MFKVILSIIAFFMSLFAFGQIDNSKHINLENKIDAVFKGIKKTDPGVSIALLKDNEIIVQRNYGLANLEYQIPVTNKTVFHAASVSKQFTAFAILLLEKEGKLSLDDDIKKHIPELHNYKKKITLKHLATHTSGIKDQHNITRLAEP